MKELDEEFFKYFEKPEDFIDPDGKTTEYNENTVNFIDIIKLEFIKRAKADKVHTTIYVKNIVCSEVQREGCLFIMGPLAKLCALYDIGLKYYPETEPIFAIDFLGEKIKIGGSPAILEFSKVKAGTKKVNP